jgi:Peptidase family C25
MLRTPGGPVAIIAGTSVSMPYGCISLADALLHCAFDPSHATWGDAILAAQCELLDAHSPRRAWFDQLAGLLGTDPAAREAERREHLQMFHLLGDPLMRVPFPATARIVAPAQATAGDTIRIQLALPLSGSGRLELTCQRGRLRFTARSRTKPNPLDAQQQHEWDREYLEANSDTWSYLRRDFRGGESEVELIVPQRARGFCQVRLFVANENRAAQGSAPIYIQAPRTNITSAPPAAASSAEDAVVPREDLVVPDAP